MHAHYVHVRTTDKTSTLALARSVVHTALIHVGQHLREKIHHNLTRTSSQTCALYSLLVYFDIHYHAFIFEVKHA